MAKPFSKGGEPSLKDQIDASGETEIDPVRAALGEDMTDRRFLGREFLTWLIFHADDENGGGEFVSTDLVDAFRVIVGERVVLKALGDGSGEITARGAAPAQSADVRYAIAGGLTVREADLLFERGDRTWQAAVSAEQFDLKRVKLPALLSEEDSERAQERLSLLDELDAMLKAAFNAFLAARLAPSWQKSDVPELRGWLARSILEKKQLELELAGQGTAHKGRSRSQHAH